MGSAGLATPRSPVLPSCVVRWAVEILARLPERDLRYEKRGPLKLPASFSVLLEAVEDYKRPAQGKLQSTLSDYVGKRQTTIPAESGVVTVMDSAFFGTAIPATILPIW
jgi:hypothetical protein